MTAELRSEKIGTFSETCDPPVFFGCAEKVPTKSGQKIIAETVNSEYECTGCAV